MAQDEHSRQLAAGLAVMAGDVRQLAASAKTQRREGLRVRLAGDLSSLPLLLRRVGGDAASVPSLRAALAKEDWRSLERGLAALRQHYPLDLRTLLPAAPTPERLRLGEAIHRQTCAGCHDASTTDTNLPALNLFEQSRHMPREEFAARLIIGVRGDVSTAYRNPFSDLELGALIAYYGSTNGKSVPWLR
ncbi:MAG TPA: cytochrome c [Sulfuricella sp.]|nr:cytochrome c [Sulfuricella sp.]